jgi:monoamine oxidase
MKVWAEDPLARGAYSAWDGRSLGRRHLFERMHGAVAFAGEHTAGEHSGTMEGALRSGRRAASQVLGLLGRA